LQSNHNYSRYAREETRRFIEEVKASGLYDYIYDLFAIEIDVVDG